MGEQFDGFGTMYATGKSPILKQLTMEWDDIWRDCEIDIQTKQRKQKTSKILLMMTFWKWRIANRRETTK